MAADTARAMDITNDMIVGVQGDQVMIVRGGLRALTPDQAIRFAAWLIVNAEAINTVNGRRDGPTIEQYLEAIQKT